MTRWATARSRTGILGPRHAASGAGGRQVRPAHLLHRAEPRRGRCVPQGGAEGRRQGQRQARACAPTTARTTTPRSRSIRTAIGSKPGAAKSLIAPLLSVSPTGVRIVRSNTCTGRNRWHALHLVTGGTRGIGAAISVALKQQGRIVVANLRRQRAGGRRIPRADRHPHREIRCRPLRGMPSGGPAHHRGSRADRGAGEQRRHHPRRHAATHVARHVGCGDRYQPRLLLQPVQADLPGDARRGSSAASSMSAASTARPGSTAR